MAINRNWLVAFALPIGGRMHTLVFWAAGYSWMAETVDDIFYLCKKVEWWQLI